MNKPLQINEIPTQQVPEAKIKHVPSADDRFVSRLSSSFAGAALGLAFVAGSASQALAQDTAETQYAPDGSIYSENLNRYDFDLRLRGYTTPFCFKNNQDAIGTTCAEFDPRLEFTRALTRNERADGRVDGDEDNHLRAAFSFQLPIAATGLKVGPFLGLDSNLGYGTDYFTGLDLEYRRPNFEAQLIYVPQNLGEGIAPYEVSAHANFMLVPERFAIGLGGAITSEKQAIYIESNDYSVVPDRLAWLNLDTEFRVNPEDRFCAGLGVGIGLSQPDTYGFSLTLSNCSHLHNNHQLQNNYLQDSEPVVVPVIPPVAPDNNPQSQPIDACTGNLLPTPTVTTTPVNCPPQEIEPQPQDPEPVNIPVVEEPIVIPIAEPEPTPIAPPVRPTRTTSRPRPVPPVAPENVVTVPPVAPTQTAPSTVQPVNCVDQFRVCMEQQSTDQVRINVNVEIQSCLQSTPQENEFNECILPANANISEIERVCREQLRDSFEANICQ